MSRKVLWILFLIALGLTLGLKAAQLGWFTPHPPLEMNEEPVLLFFNKSRGCECEMLVYNNAETQINTWDTSIRVVRIDLDHRPDLARQYEVIRAPSLVLLDSDGKTVWRQDESIGDESPLDIIQAKYQIDTFLKQ